MKVLFPEDFYQIYSPDPAAAPGRNAGGCFALLEGGYNHKVLGHNVMALIEGLSGNWLGR